MKIKIFEPPLPSLDVEQMSNGGEVEPAKMFGGGNIGNFSINIDPERIAAYMANNPVVAETVSESPATIVADTVSQAPPQRVTASPTTEDIAAFNYMYGPSASEAMGFLGSADAAENPTSYSYENISRGFDQSEGMGPTYNEADIARAIAARRAAEERAAEAEAARAAEAEAAAARAAEAEAEFARQLANAELSSQEIQELIAGGMLNEEQVLTIIQNYQLSEDQLAQLYTQGLLTEEQIREIIEGEVAAQSDEEPSTQEPAAAAGLTQEQVQDLINEGRLTEDQVSDLISNQLGEYNPNIDLSGYLTTDDLSGYATQEQVQGLESLFQNYLTPEQLQSYLPQEGQYVTPEQLAEATANDYDAVIQGLTDQLGQLETKYQDVQSQYEADAVNQQIEDTKEELNNYFAAVSPSGPRTGSTSQFSSGTSFLPGGSPMGSLIGSQREGQGQDAFTSYLKTFTPSYGDYNRPFSPEKYDERNQPFTGGMYNNPFTGGMSYNPEKRSMGGQVSNGIMDLTNFDTNVQPFQNAFRPNVPRN